MAGNSNYWKNLGIGDNYDTINQNTNGLLDTMAKAQTPSGPEKSFGPEGLVGFSQIPGVGGLASGALPAAAAVAGSAVVPLAAAYGIGKLVAPKQTDALVERLKDWVGSKVPSVLNKAEAAGSAYQVGMLESIPGSGFVKKALPQDWQSELQQIKDQHKGMNALGQVVGSGVQIAAPGIQAFKGATTLGKIGAATGNAALNMLPYAAGEGLNKYAETGDVGQGLKTAGMMEAGGALAGGAIGGVAGLVAEKLPGLAKVFKKSAVDTYLKEALDIDPKAWKQGATMGGKLKGMSASNHANMLRGQFIKLGQEANITDKMTRDAWMANQASKWKAVDAAGDAAISQGFTVKDLLPQIMDHPDIQNFVQENGDKAINKVNELVSQASQKQNIAGVRSYLEKPIDFVMRPNSAATIFDHDTAEASGAIRDIFDTHFVPDSLKAEYAKDKVLKLALEHKDLRLNTAGFTIGSQTAGRLMGSALAGGAMGAMTGEGDLKKTATRSAIGAIAGGLGQAAGVKLANKGMGILAGKLVPLIPEMEAKSGAPISNAITNILPKVGGIMMNKSPAGEEEMPNPPPSPATPIPNSQPQNVPAQTAGAFVNPQDFGAPVEPVKLPLPQPAPIAPEPPKTDIPEHQVLINQIFKKQQDLSPEQSQNVEKALSPFKQHVVDTLKDKYDNWQYKMKLPWDVFLKDAMQKTNNFDAMNPNTAQIISGADYERYLRTAAAVHQFQTLPKDLTDVMWNPVHAGGEIGALLRPGEKEKHDLLVKTLYTAMTGDLKDPPVATQKQISDKLIDWARGGNTSAKKVLEKMANEYNLDLNTMSQYQFGE